MTRIPISGPSAMFHHHRDWLATITGKKYPAKQHWLKVKSHYLEKTGVNEDNLYFFISGEFSTLYPYCDQGPQFRQNRYFYYLTGVDIPGSHVLFNVKTEKSILFLPNIDYEDVMWSGLPLSIKQAYKKFDIDEIKYESDLSNELKSIKTNDKNEILTIDITKINEPFKSFLSLNKKLEILYALDESRLIKDDYELALIRHASQITDKCHLATMSAVPIESNEGHIHAEFIYHAIRQGSKHQSYDPICCSGPNCGTLHYVKNDEEIIERESLLIDAGAEWQNYSSDVTRCWPYNGVWSKDHLNIYNIVLEMQKRTLEQIEPGNHWDNIHLLAHKVLIKNFLNLGIFQNGSIEEIFDSKISTIFFPHGLGHLLGMDTHDVGGFPNYNDKDILLAPLRLRRVLQKGMVLTDEPGVYFNKFLFDNHFKNYPNNKKFINEKELEKYWRIGGVRIEDDILVTDNGYENLTFITKDPEEISDIVTRGIEKGRSHFHVIA